MHQLPEQDVSVRECFFNNKGVRSVVAERIPQCRGFSSALGCVIVATLLNDSAEFAVGMREAGVRFLDVHYAKLFTEGRLGKAET